MSRIPDINDNELLIAETPFMERYSKKKELQVVNTDIKLNSAYKEATECPAMCPQDHGSHFSIFKASEKQYGASRIIFC